MTALADSNATTSRWRNPLGRWQPPAAEQEAIALWIEHDPARTARPPNIAWANYVSELEEFIPALEVWNILDANPLSRTGTAYDVFAININGNVGGTSLTPDMPSVANQSYTVTGTSSGEGSVPNATTTGNISYGPSWTTVVQNLSSSVAQHDPISPYTDLSASAQGYTTFLTTQTRDISGTSLGATNAINGFHIATPGIKLSGMWDAVCELSGATTVVQNLGSLVTQYDSGFPYVCVSLSAFPPSWTTAGNEGAIGGAITGVFGKIVLGSSDVNIHSVTTVLATAGLNFESGPQAGESQTYGAVAIGSSATDVYAKADHAVEAPEHVLDKLFNMEPMSDFEDGVSNTFSEGIEFVVREYGNKAITVLENTLVHTGKMSCVAEALRTLGLMDEVRTAERRFRLLVRLLGHVSAVVRDGAAIGLAYLDDERAVPEIDKAIKREPLPFLRRDMEAIREQLARH